MKEKMNLMTRYCMLACAAVFAVACSEKETSPELSEPAVIAMQNAGSEPQKIELYDSGSVSEAKAQFRVEAESISDKTLNITFRAEPLKVEEYNAEHGTDYKMAPSECYDMAGAEVLLPRYNTVSSTAEVTVSTAGIPDSETYLLPVVIDKVSGDEDVTVDSGKDAIYIIIKKYVLKEPVLLDRSGWEVIYCDSEANESMYNGYPYGPVKYILDNVGNTWWNYNTSTKAPFTFVIDLKEEIYVKKIRLTARPDTGDNKFKTRGAPRNVDFAFASSISGTGPDAVNGDYSDFEVFTDLEQFRSRLNFTGDITLGGLYRCRYIKVRYNGAWKNADSGAPDYISETGTYNAGMLAEFEALGYTDSPYE